MKILIDFDDVLFNTKRFKSDLQNLFFQGGISREIFDKYYASDLVKSKTYDPWGHLDLIERGEGIKADQVRKGLEEFMTDTNPYLFEDSVDFLKSFEKEFVCIISYGDSKFQGMKIGECRVGKYCREINITNELKSGVVEKIMKGKEGKEKIFFIEDRVEQIEDVKKKFPFITAIFIRRPEGRYHDEPTKFCDFEARSLVETEQFIRLHV